MDWKAHKYQAGQVRGESDAPPAEVEHLATRIEPWLAAALQSEHTSLLLGSGFTAAVGHLAKAKALDMSPVPLSGRLGRKIQTHADASAKAMGRGSANIEDQLRSADAVLQGLKVSGPQSAADRLKTEINTRFSSFLDALLKTELGIKAGIEADIGADKPSIAQSCLLSFLVTFASRSASRERLNLFTTNYDRLIEFGCDGAGIRLVDRFVGSIAPVFRASRLEVDLHYNPPGIRGEPRFLEGVARYTKLHGSLDWLFTDRTLRRSGLPFGAPVGHTDIPADPSQTVMIYPNAAKDFETAQYPYAELFRDFSAALCRPNSTLFTYGYGFGDDHINRVIADMLTLPSTHLAVMSWDAAGGRIQRFVERFCRPAQCTLLLGSHFGDLRTLVQHYLPKPAIDSITGRMADLMRNRGISMPVQAAPAASGVEIEE